MNVAIYDTEHFETTYTLIGLFDAGNHQITVFTTLQMAEVLKSMPAMPSQVQWILLEQGKMNHAQKLYQHCKNDVRLLILNTVPYHHLLFGMACLLLKNTATIVTVHDANSFFNPGFKPDVRSIIRSSGKKLLKSSADAYMTLLSSTKEYIIERFFVSKPVFCVPGSFYEEENGVPPNFKTVVVVSGSVDAKRRRYDQFFQVLQSMQDVEIEFVLLGAAKDAAGKEIIHKCKGLESDKLQIKVYKNSFVSQQIYESELKRCHFIYAPLQKQFTGESSVPEEYGLTKSSGIFFDAIRFGKPLLISSEIHLPPEIAPQCIVHHSAEELIDFLTNITEEEKKRISESAIDNSAKFSLENIRKDFFEALRHHKLV